MDLKNTLLIAVGAVGSYFLRLYHFALYTIRLDGATMIKLYAEIERRRWWKYIFHDAYSNYVTGIPEIESSFVWMGFPLHIDVQERLLTAGHASKDSISILTTPRIFRRRLLQLLSEVTAEQIESPNVQVHLGLGWRGFVPIHELNKEKFGLGSVSLPPEQKEELIKVVDQFDRGEREKVGILLYGPPGNGKTSIAKALACHFHYDVYVPIFKQDQNNVDLIEVFRQIPTDRRTIVVLEDFDNVFHGRKPVWKDCAFSLDVILNILDGLYINVEKMLFVMTANQIEKIDSALRHRPSRFDCVVKIEHPTRKSRVEILAKRGVGELAEKLADLTEGQSAAVVKEVGTRNLTASDDLDQEVAKILATFADDVPELHAAKRKGATKTKRATVTVNA